MKNYNSVGTVVLLTVLASEAIHRDHEAVVQVRRPAQARHFRPHILSHRAATPRSAAAEVATATRAASGVGVLALGGSFRRVLPAGRAGVSMLQVRIRILSSPFPCPAPSIAAAAVVLHPGPWLRGEHASCYL